MSRTIRALLAWAPVTLALTAVLLAQTQSRPQQPARDTPAQQAAAPADTPKGRIRGRVVTADTGRPVQRARVFVNAPELQGGRAILTDDNGVFDFTELPECRYSVTVSKTGFINLS